MKSILVFFYSAAAFNMNRLKSYLQNLMHNWTLLTYLKPEIILLRNTDLIERGLIERRCTTDRRKISLPCADRRRGVV
jgi:hypothetical protein